MVKSTAVCMESAYPASKNTPAASPPCFLMFSAASFALASLKSAITTFALSLAISGDMDNPMPEAPPVTNFTLYSSHDNPPALQNVNSFALLIMTNSTRIQRI
jgi:hypothetical protein